MFDIVYDLMLELINMLGWLIPMYIVLRIIFNLLLKGVR